MHLSPLRIIFWSITFAFAVASFADAPEQVFDAERLKPAGQRYECDVPDTLDLAERARLAVHGLTSFLNAEAGYAPYGHTYFNANPPYLSDMPGGPPNWGKIAESLVLARLMSGSEENLDVDAKTLQGMLESPWMAINPVAPTPVSVTMQALTTVHEIAPTPGVKTLIDGLAAKHVEVASVDGERAWYYDGPPDAKETALGMNGYWLTVFIQGRAMRSLTRWGEVTQQPDYVAFTGRLANYVRQPKFWHGEVEPKAVFGPDHGQFNGHHHSYTQALLGLLAYADATNDARLKEFVRSSYEYMRTFGIARIGLFGEGCTTGDMTVLAVKLSQGGAGDYWGDVDRYVRNHLAELQITDAATLRAAVEQMPKDTRGKNDTTQGPFDPANESRENVIERNVGVFMSDATHPTLIPEHNLLYTICCTGNCTPAMFCAWAGIVTCDDGNAQVNLLLNRASPWLDVDSYLPYEGKVVIRNKTARSVSVRMPLWVDRNAVHCTVSDAPTETHWLNRYLVIPSANAGDTFSITFPVVEREERYTLKWRQSEFWKESTNPGPSWQPDPEPLVLTCRFRGNTLIDISPRAEGPGYPLYQRNSMAGGPAPMKHVTRYIPATLPRW